MLVMMNISSFKRAFILASRGGIVVSFLLQFYRLHLAEQAVVNIASPEELTANLALKVSCVGLIAAFGLTGYCLVQGWTAGAAACITLAASAAVLGIFWPAYNLELGILAGAGSVLVMLVCFTRNELKNNQPAGITDL